MLHSHKDFSKNGSKFAHAANSAKQYPICMLPGVVKPEGDAKSTPGRKSLKIMSRLVWLRSVV